jgi:hypothetical protein
VSDEHDRQQGGRRRYRIAAAGGRSPASTTVSGAHIDDLAAAYALGALEAEESAAVDAHARGCPACERALWDARRTAGMLSFLVPMHAPPADSKAALFARVAHAHKAAAASSLPTQPQPVGVWRTPTLPSSEDHDLVYPIADAAVVAQASPAPPRSSRLSWLVTAVSMPLLIALVATGFWGMQLRNQLTLQDAQLAEMQAELANFGSGTTSYQLSPGISSPQAEGQIVMGADQMAGMIQIDLNSRGAAGAYELWLNQDGKLVPAAELTVNQDGRGQARFELTEPFGEYESVHIKAKPDDTVTGSQGDTLLRDNVGGLGSTGSSLDVGP